MSFRRPTSKVWLLALAFAASTAAATMVHAQAGNGSNDVPGSGNPQVVLRTTMGDVIIELDAENAPRTVDNFLSYVDNDFYTGTLFHRVIEGFMIQGGGFTTSYQKKPTRPPVSNEAYNGLQNRKYSIAMARTTAPHSATSQFFINTENNRNLNHRDTTARGWGYTVFGQVLEGQQIVDAISRVKTGSGGHFRQDVPVVPIIIEGIERHDPNAQSRANKESKQDTAAVNPASKVIQDAHAIQGSTTLQHKDALEKASDNGSVNQN